MKITSPKLETSHLTANEQALLRCETALSLKDKGNYEAAQQVMRPIWTRLGDAPRTHGLHASVRAEVFLTVGILTGWIGSRHEITEGQESAKDLITEAITFYESIGDAKKVAACRVELAYCYWRAGELDEARVTLLDALQHLTTEGNTRARALLRLAIVEWSASRYNEALTILNDNSTLFKKITNHSLRGTYHNQMALVLRNIATPATTQELFQNAIKEYEKADQEFKLARNIVFRAHIKNNVAFLLLKLRRFQEAYKYAEEARRLTQSARDKVRSAQVDDTRAQILIEQNKYVQAETIIRSAVSVFEKSGHQCLLADALITHGIALARLDRTEQAQFTFQRAIEVAHQVGALNKAGLGALTLIEELDHLPGETLQAAYNRASEWLANSQSQDILLRLNSAARRVLVKVRGEPEERTGDNHLENKPCDLQAEVLRYEGALISQALAKVSGSVTRAAALLGMSYQGLAYVIESRHKDLLKERSPIRRRTRR